MTGRDERAGRRATPHPAGLAEHQLAPDPVAQFERWLADVLHAHLPEPHAMVLGTAGPDGQPSARTVLLKGVDARGFVFFTNYQSRKGRELAANPRASLLFPWHELGRQVVVAGTVEQLSRTESEAYFATRPRGSQLGAWASEQSTVIDSRDVLDRRLAEATARYAGHEVPAPEWWGGFRVVPDTVEFWQGRVNRLHDRLRYRRTAEGWLVERLAP